MTRVWVYGEMTSDATLMALIPGGVHSSTSLNATPHNKPFIMYRQTSDVQTFRGDDGDVIRQRGYMIFAHDVPGDYLRIDSVIARLKVLFADVVDQAQGIVKSTWLETSDDLRDEDMGTILQYGRILVTYRA